MDYEKKYKELEGKIKKAYLYAQTDSTKAVLEDILPELAESEDEKIRKSIIENLKGNMYRADGDYDLLNKQISWLEKQCRKETTWNKEDEENVNNILYVFNQLKGTSFYKEDDTAEKIINWLKSIKDRLYSNNEYDNDMLGAIEYCIKNNRPFEKEHIAWLEKQVEKPQGKSALEAWKEKKVDNRNKVEQKFKDGDVLVASDGSIFLFAGVVDCACKYYVALTTDNYVKINKEKKGGYWETSRAVYPATREQRDKLEKAMADAGYEWDAEKKELKLLITNGGDFEQENCEQNPAWSESDEEEFQIAIDTLVEAGQRDSAHWLESIKDRVQPHWKPSDEQIDAFEHFVKSIGESGYAYPHNHNTKCVYSLLNDLKKL